MSDARTGADDSGPASARPPDPRLKKRWTRRRLLALGTIGGLSLALPYRFLGYGDLRPFSRLSHLSPAQGLVLTDAIDALLPPAASRSPEDRAERVQFLDGYLAGLPADAVDQIRQLLFALEHLTLPFGGRLQRFTRLDPEDQRACVESWRTSGLGLRRQGYRGLVGLTFMSYYRTQAAFDSIGYPGPIARTVVAPLANLERYDALLAASGQPPGFG